MEANYMVTKFTESELFLHRINELYELEQAMKDNLAEDLASAMYDIVKKEAFKPRKNKKWYHRFNKKGY